MLNLVYRGYRSLESDPDISPGPATAHGQTQENIVECGLSLCVLFLQSAGSEPDQDKPPAPPLPPSTLK